MPFYNLSRTVLAICFGTKNDSKSFQYSVLLVKSRDTDYFSPSWHELWYSNLLGGPQRLHYLPLLYFRQQEVSQTTPRVTGGRELGKAERWCSVIYTHAPSGSFSTIRIPITCTN